MREPNIERKATGGTHARARVLSPNAQKSSDVQASGSNILRQRLGNQGVQALAAGVIARSAATDVASSNGASSAQPSISQPGDAHEREADWMADIVMRMPAPVSAPSASAQRIGTAAGGEVQRMCAECDEESKEQKVQRKEGTADAPQVAPAVAVNISALRGGGSPLSASTRDFFEPRFGADFSRVRVHTGARAADTAKSIHAKAFTVEQDIVFGQGQYAPESADGQRLLAHELTHTIQQAGNRASPKLQRKPDRPAKSKPTTTQPAIFIPATDLAPPLFFAQPFHAEPIDLTKPGALAGERFVSEVNIVEWAARRIWNDMTLLGGTPEKDRLVKLLRRGEDAALHASWRPHANSTLMRIAPSGFADVPGTGAATSAPKVEVLYPANNPFRGPEEARRHWAKFLFANWSRVEARLDQYTTDLYVEKIKGALRTKVIPPGALLVKQAQRVLQIEDSPGKSFVPLGRWGAIATVGLEWMGKRMKSVSPYAVVFEVVGHEGVYFEMSTDAFLKTDPFVGKVVSDVAKNTKGTAIVGQFIKGFLNALASPVLIVLDTGAKVLDMATMAVSAFGKWRGWYDVGYTCLSSTCRHYEECLGTKSTSDCKSDVLQQALEEATIIIPIYRQGAECLEGDAEACGGIAALGLGLIEGGVRGRVAKSKGKLLEAEGAAGKGRQMTPGEFQDALIRDAIDRPRPGESGIGKAFEEPAAREKPSQSRLDIEKPAKPAPKGAQELATERTVDAKAAQAGSEVRLGDGKHGVAAAGEGKNAGFRLCSSHCSLVADKLEQIEHVLPEKSAMRRDVNFLKKKVRGLDTEVQSGRLTQEMADRAARDIANNLRDSAGTPIMDTLLQMSVEDLRANRASLKKQVGRAFQLGEEVAKKFKEAGKKGVKEEPPEGTHATGKTPEPTTAVLTDAQMLAAELKRDVGPRPPGHEAHHIIPKGMKQAAEARAILEEAGIGINESANGIWLPKDTSVANTFASDIHSKVHTKRAIRIMTEQLREGAKGGPAGVRRALRQIQLTLSDLKFER
jgi:hypothetical protein